MEAGTLPMTEPAAPAPAQPQRSTTPHPHPPRGLARDLLDELAVRGPSPEFWTRYFRLAPFLRGEEQDFICHAAAQTPLRHRSGFTHP